MRKIEKNDWIIFLSILFVYILSWFLPILDVGVEHQYYGLNGANYAHSILIDGVNFLITGERQSNGIKNIYTALVSVYAGLPNILFALCFTLLIFIPKWCYLASPTMICSMLIWFSFNNLIGYYVWVIIVVPSFETVV